MQTTVLSARDVISNIIPLFSLEIIYQDQDFLYYFRYIEGSCIHKDPTKIFQQIKSLPLTLPKRNIVYLV